MFEVNRKCQERHRMGKRQGVVRSSEQRGLSAVESVKRSHGAKRLIMAQMQCVTQMSVALGMRASSTLNKLCMCLA